MAVLRCGTGALMAAVVFLGLNLAVGHARPDQEPAAEMVEKAVLAAVPAAYESPDASERRQEESYQRVYEAFSRLMQTTTQNSLGNVRRLVNRLNRLVGTPPAPQNGYAVQQSIEDRTEQILERLDQVNRDTDQHTISKLQEDISKLVGTMNESYLRNIRRVIERVNRLVGSSSIPAAQMPADKLADEHERLPGFPGLDELIFALDRTQKSLAHFVRSTTRLVASG